MSNYYCGERGKPCEYANSNGHCQLTGCRKEHTSQTYTIDMSKAPVTVVGINGICAICGNEFNAELNSNYVHVCPECLKRLKKILYPEEN